MTAGELVAAEGEKLIGRKVIVEPLGLSPGGISEVIELGRQPHDVSSFFVWIPSFGTSGIFEIENVVLCDRDGEADFYRAVLVELKKLRDTPFSTKHEGEESWKNKVASDLNALTTAGCSISGNRTLPDTILRIVQRVAEFEKISKA